MNYYMGIDGGGTNLRVVITDPDLTPLAETYRGSANPSLIGRDGSAVLIQEAMRETLSQVDAAQVVSVGIGIAGASKYVAGTWLGDTVRGVLPTVTVAEASDNEIALVGATGKRAGLLLLAGTGSVGFGINDEGDELQVGGWGYLLGDEGSGYWLGMEALKAVTRAMERDQFDSVLVQNLRAQEALHIGRDVVNWVYHHEGLPVPRVAKLAPLVLEAAAEGDFHALDIIERGSEYFAELAGILRDRLNMPNPEYAFAGGLLTSDNALSQRVLTKLGLSTRPQAQHTPMIGAARLAKIIHETNHDGKQVTSS